MAITPKAGYITDPNNPNGVIRDVNVPLTIPAPITGSVKTPSGATVNAITGEMLQPTSQIQIPPPPTDTNNYDAIRAGGQAAIDAYNKALEAQNKPTEPTVPDWFSQYLNQPAPASTADLYNTEYTNAGIDTLNQDTLAQQKTLKTAQDKLAAVNARLAGINAEAQAIPIKIQQETEGRGRTAGGVAPLQTAQLRENALKALPLQAEAIAAQAEVQAAQGNVELSQNTLRLAQDKLNTVFELRSKDAENQYNYQKDLRDKVYEFATQAEKNKLDSLQKEDDRKFELMKDSINNAQSLAKTAMENGQASIASQITVLDPKSSTYKTDLASLQGQIKPKEKKLDTSVVSILDVTRYNELYPDAGVTAGDTEAQANAKVAKSNTPETKTRALVVAAQSAGNTYDTVVSEINNDATIKDKATALSIAKEVYGITDTTTSPIETEIARLKAGGNLIDSDIRATLRNRYSPDEVNNSSVGSFLDKIGSFLFGK